MVYDDDVHFNIFLAAMRKGKNITLERLSWGICSISLIGRIESGERQPDKLMRDRLMDRLGMVNDGFEDFLSPDEYALWKERQTLLQAIENKDIATAERLIHQYETDQSRNNAIERQFYLTMKIQMMQYRKDADKEVREALRQAIALTIPDCSMAKWSSRLLAVQEWNLLLEYIRYGGNVRVARIKGRSCKVAAYEKMLEVIEKSGMDIYGCVKIYPKTVYYLCQQWMKSPVEDWDCRKMYDLAEKALDMLRSANRMYYLCETLEIMERILAVWIEREDMTQKESMRLRPMLAQVREWSRVLAEVFGSQGVSDKMENCCYLYRQMYNYRIGDVVRKRRKMLGKNAKALCHGTCGEKTLRRLENHRCSTHMDIVGELLKGMGMAPDYQRKRITTDQYEAMVLFDRATRALNNQDMETLGSALSKLRDILPMDFPDNRQEMDFLETLYLWHSKKIKNEECIRRLQQALEYTVPLKCVKQMEEGFLTRAEMDCLHNIARRMEGAEKKVYMDLLRKICEQLVEEDKVEVFASTYELTMYNVASYLGDEGEYAESDKICHYIMKLSLSLRRDNMLHMCIYNNLWNQMKNTSADRKSFVESELQKCLQLAKLCKDTFYEEFYNKKINHILHKGTT